MKRWLFYAIWHTFSKQKVTFFRNAWDWYHIWLYPAFQDLLLEIFLRCHSWRHLVVWALKKFLRYSAIRWIRFYKNFVSETPCILLIYYCTNVHFIISIDVGGLWDDTPNFRPSSLNLNDFLPSRQYIVYVSLQLWAVFASSSNSSSICVYPHPLEWPLTSSPLPK